jgi:hypothetical protein
MCGHCKHCVDCTFEIDVDDGIDVFFFEVKEAGKTLNARIGKENNGWAEFFNRFVNGVLDAIFAADIGLDPLCSSSASFVPASTLTSRTATSKPSDANFLTAAAPIPVEPPVMMTQDMICISLIRWICKL